MARAKRVTKSALRTKGTKSGSTASVVKPEGPVPEATGSEKSFEKHRAAAERIPEAEVIPMRADVHLAFHNVRAASAAVVAARAAIDATGFRARWDDIKAITELAEATIYAEGRVGADPKTRGVVRLQLREARPLRLLLLSNARTQALVGAAPLAEVERIERGRGPIDAAQDLVDLATLHRKHKLTLPSNADASTHVARAGTLGTDLLRLLRPSSAKPDPRRTDAQREAALLRDRFWTLLVRTQEHLECAAGAHWGRALADHVPALQSRYVPSKRNGNKPAASNGDKKPAQPTA